MNLLLVDAGNTAIKYRMYNSAGIPVQDYVYFPGSEHTVDIPEKILQLEPDEIWISNVRGDTFPLPEKGKKQYVHTGLKLPFEVSSDLPLSLGPDRICLLAGATEIFPETTGICILAFGSALTVNLLLPGHVFAGGSISPGLKMRFRALHEFTGKLPLVYPEGTMGFPSLNTEESIRTGVMEGLLHEAEGYIQACAHRCGNEPLIILSGGDALYFENRLKKPNFVIPDLVLQGLYRLATLNRNA